MQQQDTHMWHQVAAQKHDLAVHHEWKTRAGQPDCRPEPVPVYHGINQRRKDDGEDLEGLGELEPEKRHEGEDGVVEELAERELTTS